MISIFWLPALITLLVAYITGKKAFKKSGEWDFSTNFKLAYGFSIILVIWMAFFAIFYTLK